VCWYVSVSPKPSARRWSLARQLLVLQVVIVGVLVGAGFLLAWFDASHSAEGRAADQVAAVAQSVADAPSVLSALSTPDPSGALQPYAERVRLDTHVDFVTIMDPAGIRFTHPNPALIGEHFLGNTSVALAGKVFTETYTGTLGPSVRAVVPVFGGGRVVALVATGITVDVISAELQDRLWTLIAIASAVLAIGVAGSLLVSARLKRQTRGVAPAELSTLFSYHEAVLHAVREGLVLVDSGGRVALCNDGGKDLLDVGELVGRAVADLGLPGGLEAAFTSAEPRTDEIHVTDTRVLVVSTSPVRSEDRAMGTVVTLRDHTELQTLTGELTTARGFAESLRSQAHEAANRLHTVVSLVEIGRPEQAVEFATAELELAQRLTDQVVGAVAEPVLAALLLGKAAEAAERGVDLTLTPDTAITEVDANIAGRDLVTILGNLIDNAIDAALEGQPGAKPGVVVTARVDAGELFLRVADTGPGLGEAAVAEVFRRGWSTKPSDGEVGHGLGLALVGQAVRRYGGGIDVTHEAGAVFTVRLPWGVR
jgi:two-component system CitB family sensor kinase